METILDTVKYFLELLYLASGPVLAFFAYKALDQIKTTKEIAKTNSKREAYKVTIDECRHYTNEIIPLVNKLDKLVDEHKIEYISKSQVIAGYDSFRVIPFCEDPNHNEKFDIIIEDACHLANKLEDFATFFTSGIADESLAYSSLAYTYCNTIKKYADLVTNEPGEHHKDNVLKLFFIWNNRLEKEKLILDKAKIDAQIQINKDASIKPIGT
jgi:hypothetical protein